MKTKTDPRHQKRRETVSSLFSYLFCKEQELSPAAKLVIDNLEVIDKEIVSSAQEWPLERINKIDLTILRLAIFELIIEQSQPPKVIIDEAIELAKEFGSETSASFVNGVLGNIWTRKEKNDNTSK